MNVGRLARFFAIGVVCFIGDHALRPAPDIEAPACAHTTEGCDDEALLAHAGRRLRLHEHDDVVRRRLVANLRALGASPDTSDAALVREAIALGMQDSDPVVRRRLANIVRLRIASATIDRSLRHGTQHADGPGVDSNRTAAGEPMRELVTVQHVFFDLTRRGDAARKAALTLASTLRAARNDGTRSASDPAALRESNLREGRNERAERITPLAGDPHLAPARLGPLSRASLARWFGDAIASEAFRAPVDAWVGPLASPAGWHLLRVVSRTTVLDPPPAMQRARRDDDQMHARIDVRIREIVGAIRSRMETAR
jgi:hypothetical protein